MKKIFLSVLMAIGLCAMCFADENHDERLIGKWELTLSYVKIRANTMDVAYSPTTMEIKEDGTVIITSTGILNGVTTTNEYKWSTKVEKGKSLYVRSKTSEIPTYKINEDGDLEFTVVRKAGMSKNETTDVYTRIE